MNSRAPARLVLLSAIALVAAFGHATASPFPFAASLYPYGTAGFTYSCAFDDLDADGRDDLIVATSVGIEVLRGRPGPSLDPPRPWVVGTVYSVAVGDFDADGRRDVAAMGESTLVVAFGDGSLGVADSLTVAVPPRGMSLVAGDLDSDGRDDLVVTADSSQVVVFRSLPGRTLAAAAPVTAGVYLGEPVLADFDDDGNLDAAVGEREQSSYSVMLGHGDGSFAPPVAASSSAPAYYALAAPLEAAPGIDLLLGSDARFQLHGGLGDGSFAGAVTINGGSAHTRSVAAGDLDGDGDLDVTAQIVSPQTLGVWLNRGDGTFDPPALFPGLSFTNDVALGDVDGDGRLDAVVLGAFVRSFGLFPGNGDGSFGVPATDLTPVRTYGMALADFDEDGDADAVITRNFESTLQRLDSDGAGRLGAPVALAAPAFYRYLAAGRFDADAHRDVAGVINGAVSSLHVLPGAGNGTFGAPAVFALGNDSRAPVPCDLNADGRTDLAILNAASGTVSVLLQGVAGLAAPVTVPVSAGSSTALAVGDLTGDGRADLAVGNVTSLQVFPGDGAGAFGAAVVSSPASPFESPTSLAIADFDEDGLADLAWSYGTTGSTSAAGWSRNLGGGALGPAMPVSIAWSPDSSTAMAQSVGAADVDHDGHADLLVQDLFRGAAVQFLRGRGDGSFEPTRVHGAGYRSQVWGLADTDADGWDDIVVVTARNNGSSWTHAQAVVLRNRVGSAVTGVGPGGGGAAPLPALALRGPWPNPGPAEGATSTLSCVLARQGELRLEIFDVAGRRIAARDLGPLPAGEHRIALPELGGRSPGLWWVRILDRRSGAHATAKALVLR